MKHMECPEPDTSGAAHAEGRAPGGGTMHAAPLGDLGVDLAAWLRSGTALAGTP